MLMPSHYASSAGNRLEKPGSWSSGPLSPTSTSKEKQWPSSAGCAFRISQPFAPCLEGACPAGKPRASAATPAPQLGRGRYRAEARALRAGVAGRKALCSGSTNSQVCSDFSRPQGGRKMAARSAVDSHVSRRYRPAPPPPLVESLFPWEAQLRAASATWVPRSQAREAGRRDGRPAFPAGYP